MTSFSDAAKSPKIEMVFLDVDGTLLDDDHEMAPRTIAAIRDVAATGTQISFASGRPLKSLLHVA